MADVVPLPVDVVLVLPPKPRTRNARRKIDGRTCGVVVFVTVTVPSLLVSTRMFPLPVAVVEVPLPAARSRAEAGGVAVSIVAGKAVAVVTGAMLVVVPASRGDVPRVGVATTFPIAAGALTSPLPTWVEPAASGGVAVPAIGVAVVFVTLESGELVMPAITAPVEVTAPIAAGTATAPTPSPAPLLIAGVGPELIDALMVVCGFAALDGDTNCPVTCCMLLVSRPVPGAAGPRTTP
ncbi:MAG TPA: hypothetical protein VMS98_11745 [Thermoanaerobaculia bacterium]|nr:hypothetical protein [Thermoanaerobaculia bacterium]